jgi:hypothetical protein
MLNPRDIRNRKHASSYSFLQEELGGPTVLSMDVEGSVDDPDGKIKTYLCVYTRNKQTAEIDGTPNVPLEFISYWMMRKKDKHHKDKYTFPTFVYLAHDNDNHAEYDDEDEAADSFRDECVEHILASMNLRQTKGASRISFGYRGIIPLGDNRVCAMFDYDELMLSGFRPTKQTGKWVIADEILHRKSVLGIRVDTVIAKMFKEHPVIWQQYYDNRPVAIPKQMYSLVADDEDDPKTYRTETADDSLTRLPHALSHLFAQRYLMTEHPIEQVRPIEQVPQQEHTRYACFLHDVYVPSQADLENMPEDMEDDRIETLRDIPYVVFMNQASRPVSVMGISRPDLFMKIP